MKRSKIDLAAARVAAPTLVADLALVDGGMPPAHQGRSYSWKPESNTSQSYRDSQPTYSTDLARGPTERSSPYTYTPPRSSQAGRDSNPSGRSYMASRYPQR